MSRRNLWTKPPSGWTPRSPVRCSLSVVATRTTPRGQFLLSDRDKPLGAGHSSRRDGLSPAHHVVLNHQDPRHFRHWCHALAVRPEAPPAASPRGGRPSPRSSPRSPSTGGGPPA